MKFIYKEYELDTEKFYLDNIGDICKFAPINVPPANSSWLGYSTEDERMGTFNPSEDYLSKLREIEIKGSLRKVFVPRKGQLVMVTNTPEAEWVFRVFDHLSLEGFYRCSSRGWKYCKPVPKELIE